MHRVKTILEIQQHDVVFSAAKLLFAHGLVYSLIFQRCKLR